MPLTIEEQQLLLKVTGQVELERLNKELAKEEAALYATVKAGQAAMGGQAAFEEAVSRSAAELSRLTDEIKRAQSAAGASQSQINGLNGAIKNLGFGISDVFSNNGPIGQKIQGFANNVGNIVTGIMQSMGKLGPWALAFAAGIEIAFTMVGAAMTAFGVKTVEDIKNLFSGAEKKAKDSLKGIPGQDRRTRSQADPHPDGNARTGEPESTSQGHQGSHRCP